jgi:hypothetical protein
MRNPSGRIIASLISEEIRRVIADAVADGEIIAANRTAADIMRAYPACGLGESDIVNEIVLAAARAGVAVEFGGRKLAA